MMSSRWWRARWQALLHRQGDGEDTNQNGLQDSGEPPVVGATVNLWTYVNGAPGEKIGTATTDDNGMSPKGRRSSIAKRLWEAHYRFDGLDADLTYVVQFVDPSGPHLVLPLIIYSSDNPHPTTYFRRQSSPLVVRAKNGLPIDLH